MRLFSISLAAIAATFCVAQASSVMRNPISTVLIVKEPIIHTNHSSVHALTSFTVTFWIGNLHVKLDLEPNRDILDKSVTVRHLTPDGKISHLSETPRLQYKVFKGQVWITSIQDRHRWHHVGWARVLVLQDGKDPSFEGVFTVGGDRHHIQLSQRYMRMKHYLDPRVPVGKDEYMIVWRDSDVLRPSEEIQHQDLRRGSNEEQAICHADRLTFNSVATHPVFNSAPDKSRILSSRKRFVGEVELGQSVTSRKTSRGLAGSPFVSTIGQTTGCFSKRMIARVGIAADCTYTRDFDSTESVKRNIVQMVNAASAVWEDTFNITIALADLVVSNASCPVSPSRVSLWNQDCNASISPQQRLSLFSDWRTKQRDTNSHWTLLSTCQNGSTIGLAWLGQACVRDNVDSNSTIAEDAELNDT